MEGEMVSLMAQTLSTLLLLWPFLEVALHHAVHQCARCLIHPTATNPLAHQLRCLQTVQHWSRSDAQAPRHRFAPKLQARHRLAPNLQARLSHAVQQWWGVEMEAEMVSLMAQALSTLLLVWPWLEVALHQAMHQ